MRRTVGLISGLLMLLAACGDDGKDAGVRDHDAVPATGDGNGDTDQSGCDPTDIDYSGPPGSAAYSHVSAYAKAMPSTPYYIVYLADYEIDPADLETVTEPPRQDGGILISVPVMPIRATGTIDPLTVGQALEYISEPDVFTFRVSAEGDDGLHGPEMIDSDGTLTVTGLTDDWFCADIDYADADKSLRGSIEARIVKF